MDQAKGRGALLSGVAFLIGVAGLVSLALYFLSPAEPAFGGDPEPIPQPEIIEETPTTEPTETNTEVPPTDTPELATETPIPQTAEPTSTPPLATETPITLTVEPTATEAPPAEDTPVPEETEVAATSTAIPVVSGVQGGADTPVVQQPAAAAATTVPQAAAVVALPVTGERGGDTDAWLLPLGLALVALGGVFFVASRRLAR
jgi:hypothetical protein